MSKWEEKRLGEVAPFKYGKALTAEKRITGKFNVYSSAGVCGFSDDFIAKTGIVVGRKGSIGTVYLSKSPFFCIDTAFYIDEISPNCDIFFLYYYMQLLHLDKYNNDAAVPGLNRKLAEKLKIKVPDLPTQKRIADILSAYDDLIENNNRRIELLEKAAQDLYKEWFVRFRFPGYETAKFENGIPCGWEVKRLGQIFEVTSSKRVYLSDYVKEGVPFYRSREIILLASGSNIIDTLYITENRYNEFKNRFGVPQINDILVTSVGTIGVSYLVDDDKFYFKDGNLTWIKSSFNQAIAVLLFYFLNTEFGKQQLLQYTIGTSQSALTIENLKKNKVLVPEVKICEKYYNIAYPMLQERRQLQSKNQNLKKQRDLLLPRLMSGKLEV